MEDKTKKLWNFDFKKESIEYPEKIARKFCNVLGKKTNDNVFIKVVKYNKSISSMDMGIANSVSAANTIFTKLNNVQGYLGESDYNSTYTYELYLGSSKNKDYKYRFCFIEYGINGFPVDIAMDQNISSELNLKNYIVRCNNKEEFENLLISILNSNCIVEVIQKLINIS